MQGLMEPLTSMDPAALPRLIMAWGESFTRQRMPLFILQTRHHLESSYDTSMILEHF